MRTLKIYKKMKRNKFNKHSKKHINSKKQTNSKKHKCKNIKNIKKNKGYMSRIKNNLKGGFISQNIINITDDSESSINTDLEPIFTLIPEYANELIYISIGSKFNEPFFYDNSTRNLTNTGYQMVPFFLLKNSKPRENVLCENESCKILNIVIDIFNEGDIDNSKMNINNSLADFDTSNITQFFINIIDVRNKLIETYSLNNAPHITFLGNLIDIISERVKENNVDNKNFMVCNYIKFKQPLEVDSNFEDAVSKKILNILTKNGYENSCYDWCGYNPIYFYNCIRLTSKIKIFQQYNLLQLKRFQENSELDRHDPNNIFEIKKEYFTIENTNQRDKNLAEKIIDNLKYIFPIKNIYDERMEKDNYPTHRTNNFVYSIYDFIENI